jgi:hypothetical protein
MLLTPSLIFGLTYYWREYFTTLSISYLMLHFLAYHLLFNEMFHIMDLTEVVNKCKYKPYTIIPYKDLFSGALINTLSMIPFYYAYDYYGNSNKEIQSLVYTMYEVTICSVIYEAVFFAGHYLLHTKFLYIYHKKHHMTYADVAITTHYMSWIDFFIEIIFPYFIGPYLINCSQVGFVMWTFLGIFNALSTHSGYNIPYLISCEFHHTHHNNIKKNIQIDNILNYLVSLIKS